MKILALETSCERGSVALFWGGRLWEITLDGHANHSERILSVIANLLQDTGLSFSQLDAIAFGAGPGAFTGVRLACGVAQGISLARGTPLVAVGSLDALALDAPDGAVLTLTDARMGEVYCAAYQVRAGRIEQTRAPACLPPENLFCPPGDAWWAIGSALGAYASRLPAQLLGHLAGQSPEAVPRAQRIAQLAIHALERGEAVDATRAAPLYVRDKVALTTAERLFRGGQA